MPAVRACGDLKGDGGFYIEPNWLPPGTLIGHSGAQITTIMGAGTAVAKASRYTTSIQALLNTSHPDAIAPMIINVSGALFSKVITDR